MDLRLDILLKLKDARGKEKNKYAKDLLEAIIKNAQIAKAQKLAICQDTGMPVVFVDLGQDVTISGDLKQAINRGVELGYKKGFLRSSIIKNPLLRGKPGYQPAIIHIDIAKGNKLKLTVLPKGFGCENKAQLKMFKPTAELSEIKNFIIAVVRDAGADACPPYVVGVGIGGTADYACFLAKKALLKRVTSVISKIEKELCHKINKLNIGPMGLGGRTTCLGVNIETFPTHIAGLPVAVNISCHALRSASKEI
jgi:fumarate hydratase subunit alpha